MSNGGEDEDYPAALEPLERALAAWMAGRRDAVLGVCVEGDPEPDLPVAHFFREGRHLTAFDRAALRGVRGAVLDVGAGTGPLANALTAAGHRVTALEVLPTAVSALSGRGVEVLRESLWSLRTPRRWDTVMALMNGTALAGTLGRLPALLARLKQWTAPGGHILLDSTELCHPDDRMADGRFAGELHYQLRFEDLTGPPFPQLFVPEALLAREADALGLAVAVLRRDARGRYLASLSV